jgi:serine/threonine protein kinase
MDVKPRSFPSNILSVLVNFAEITTRELESGSFDTPLKLKRLGELAQRSKSDYEEPIALLDLDVKGWPVLYSNSYWEEQVDGGGGGNSVNNGGERTSTSSNRSSQDVNSFWNIFKCLDPVEISRDVPAALQSRHPIKLKVQLKKKTDGNDQHDLRVLLRPASDILAKMIPVGIPGFVPFDIDCAGHENGNLWFATLHIASSPRTSNGGRITTSTTAANNQISRSTTNPYRSTPSSGSTTPSDCTSTKRGSFESQVETPKGAVEARLKQPFAISFKNQQASIEEEDKAKPASAPSRLVAIAPKVLLPYQMALPERYSDLQVGPLLGSGRYSRVHRAVWRGSIVAVKLIEFPADASFWEDIERSVIEGALSLELRHPNIIQTFDFCRWRKAVQPDVSNAYSTAGGGHWVAPTAPLQEVDCVWLIQELCTGGTLGDALDRGWLKTRRAPDAPIDLVKYMLTAADIISAVGFLHSRGITHGNLNYNNVLLTAPHTPRDDGGGGGGSSKTDTRGFVAKIADFGLARVAQNDDSNSTRHYGDVSHQPPEILSDGILTLSTDIYSFGTLLWEMYTGVRAWRGQHQDVVIKAVCAGRGLKCLPENDTHAPEALKNLVSRCLDMDRKKRPTAVEAWNEVQAMLAENIEVSADYTSIDK